MTIFEKLKDVKESERINQRINSGEIEAHRLHAFHSFLLLNKVEDKTNILFMGNVNNPNQ